MLRTFGGLSVEAEGGAGPVPSLTPRRLALLAVVAAAGPRGITREKILGILWPDSDEEQARHTLSQTLYLLRRETGAVWISGTTQLRLDPSVTSDIGRFHEALNTDQLDRAAALYTGPFLEGFYLTGAPAFEQWAEETRARLQSLAVKAMETLAHRAVDAGAWAEAADWWRRLGEFDPFNVKFAAERIRALIDSGASADALRFAREYESRIRRELGAEPQPVIARLIAQLRSAPEPTATGPAPAFPPTAVPPAPVAEAHSPDSAPKPAQPATAIRIGRAATTARFGWRFRAPAITAALLITAAVAWQIKGAGSAPRVPPILAIGSIQSRDTAALGPVLRNMLAANLASVRGIEVVSNWRLLELLPQPGDAGPTAIADAARRAGANQIVEGELGVTASGLVLTMRRVALGSGRVQQGFTVRAADLYALTDSAIAALALDFQLDPPADAVMTLRTRSAIAYALYEQGLRSYYQGDLAAASRLMSATLDRDSAFAMAAFFHWMANRGMGRFEEANQALRLVRRLAPRAVDRERLWIEAAIAEHEAPALEFLRIAREMTERFPDDPDGQILLGTALFAVGDWAGSVVAYNRAIAIDSAAGALGGSHCRICSAINGQQNAYAWWDSIAAAERSANRLLAFRPNEGTSWASAVEPLLRQRRRSDAEAAIARADKLSAIRWDYQSWLDRDLIRWGRSDELEARLVSELPSTPTDLRGERPWLLALSLRNQGRLQEAYRLAADGIVPRSTLRLEGHRDVITLAIVALERGQPLESARRFLNLANQPRADSEGVGPWARRSAWYMTLAATALAAAGDTAAVRALADSVERIGQRSNTGRDFRLHHFLRGLLFQQQDRHGEAVESFRQSLFSVTDGYTRTNLEMARSLMVLGRHREAIAILQPALRGGVDGSNTYVTHTELHEALALAFDAAGQPDSATVHYAAVERAWRRADPAFAERYRTAQARSTPVQ